MFNFKKIFLLSILFLTVSQKCCELETNAAVHFGQVDELNSCPECRIDIWNSTEVLSKDEYFLIKNQIINLLKSNFICKELSKDTLKGIIRYNFYNKSIRLSEDEVNEIYNELMK